MKGWLRVLAMIAIGALIAACGDGRTRPPQVHVTVANAAPGFADITLYRGLNVGQNSNGLVTSLSYRAASEYTFDADTYEFRLTVVTPSRTEEVLRTFTETLVPDTRYIYVVTQSAGALEELIWSQPEFSSTSADTQFSITHASETTAAVDVYVELAGTDLLTVSPRATLGFREHQAPITAPPGEYVVTVTAPGAPSNVLFESTAVTFGAGHTHALVLSGTGNATTGDLALIVSEINQSFSDVNAPSTIRVINGAGDRAVHDVYLNDDFTTPLLAGQAFGTVSPYFEIPRTVTTFSITPEGNPSVVEDDVTQSTVAGLTYDLVITGETGAPQVLSYLDDRRVLLNQARIKFLNLVDYYTTLEIFFEVPGTDLSATSPLFRLTAAVPSSRISYPIGDFELTVRDAATGTTVFGPQTFSMPASGIYTMALIDAADGTSVDILPLDGF